MTRLLHRGQGEKVLKTLSPSQLLFRKYRLNRVQKLEMTAWGLVLGFIAAPVGSAVYFLVTQVSYQTDYEGDTRTWLYLRDAWNRLPVHIENLLRVHWTAGQAAPAWWVTARHDFRHVLIGLLVVLMIRVVTIGMTKKARARAGTLRILLSPLAVLAVGAPVGALGIVFFTKLFPRLMHLGFVSSDPTLATWLGRGSWQLTLIGAAAAWSAKKIAFDPVADTVQLMSIEKKLAAGQEEKPWWRFAFTPAYRHRFAYLREQAAAGDFTPRPHGSVLGFVMTLAAPAFLFLLGFGTWLLYFGPASGAA